MLLYMIDLILVVLQCTEEVMSSKVEHEEITDVE
jgi:hypothetical protein